MTEFETKALALLTEMNERLKAIQENQPQLIDADDFLEESRRFMEASAPKMPAFPPIPQAVIDRLKARR